MSRPLTPKQVRTIKRVWLETANASEAARQAGCSEAAARRHIGAKKRDKAPVDRATKRADLYAQSLDEAEQEHLAVVAKARRKVSDCLDAAAEVRDVSMLAAQAHDGLRAITTTKMAHAKLSGALVEKHDVTSGGAALKLYLPDES